MGKAMTKLVVYQDDKLLSEHPISAQIVNIGREANNDVVLDKEQIDVDQLQ